MCGDRPSESDFDVELGQAAGVIREPEPPDARDIHRPGVRVVDEVDRMDMGYARGLGDRPLGVPPASPLTTIASPRLSMTYGGGSGRRVETGRRPLPRRPRRRPRARIRRARPLGVKGSSTGTKGATRSRARKPVSPAPGASGLAFAPAHEHTRMSVRWRFGMFDDPIMMMLFPSCLSSSPRTLGALALSVG